MSASRTVSEIQRQIMVLEIWVWVVQNHRKWYHSKAMARFSIRIP